MVDERLTQQDDLDIAWASIGSNKKPTEVLFLSRHASASGTRCLTVHPIGNPRLSVSDQEPKLGGRAGRCPPPSSRMARLLKAVKVRAAQVGLLHNSEEVQGPADFSVCPEATHHGPWLSTPACFVEIGSADDDWGRRDAAEVWVDVLMSELFGDEIREATETDVVLIAVGGGHYAPKVMDIISGPKGHRVALGHVLASYALDFSDDGNGAWRNAVAEAVAATRVTWPAADPGTPTELVALVDKKAFRSSDRAVLVGYLRSLGVRSALKKSEVFL